MMDSERIICLIDMDCFYVQCEQRLQPDKWLKPCAVAQYNNWKGGGLIAVNYEARPFGIKRGMRGDDAGKLCPDLHIFSVPEKNGKADLDRYRSASAEVFNIISEFIVSQEEEFGKNLVTLEKASVDEAYIEFTKLIDAKPLLLPDYEDLSKFNTKVEINGMTTKEWLLNVQEINEFFENDVRLIMGAILIGKLRQYIYDKTQFRCSAGISHNKMLAKLACSTNKPNAQTILPFQGVPKFFERVDINDVRLLGGKLGRHVKENFGIKTMKELNQTDPFLLERSLDKKTAKWLHDLSCGLDDEPVVNRKISKSIGCGKNFTGKNSLTKMNDVQHWIKVLCEELYSRIENDRTSNNRIAKLFIVGYYTAAKGHCSKSMSVDISNNKYPQPEKMACDILKTVFQSIDFTDPILNLSIAASKFAEEQSIQNTKIDSFFLKVDRDLQKDTRSINSDKLETTNQSVNGENCLNLFPKDDDTFINVDDDYDSSNECHYDPEEIEVLKKTFFFRKLMEIYECED